MILLCQNCGWRINQRHNNLETPENIGKYLLYKNKPFCSEYCIEHAKQKPYILTIPIQPTDWNEQGYETWKTLRKIGRIRNKSTF
jgi:hypothetical protein